MNGLTPIGRRWLWAGWVFGLGLLSGCHRVTWDMARQPRHNGGDASPLFEDGQASRPPPPGVLGYSAGDAAQISSGRNGRWQPASVDGPVTLSLMQRGRQRYDIYCQPCHGLTGQGDGQVVLRGFPAPPSLVDAARPLPPPSQLDDVIAHGTGVMGPFGDRIDAADRRAIIAYLAALRFSQSAPIARLPASILRAAGLPDAMPEGAR